jgi:uncharacterized protein (UPF0276 family)
MNLAINYSTQAAALLQAGQIRLDRFKCPNWPHLVAEARQFGPVAVHFGFQAGQGRLPDDWEPTRRLLQETGTPYVSLHLNPIGQDFPDLPVDAGVSEATEVIYRQMLADIQTVCEQFGPERVIVEHVPYRGPAEKTMRLAVEPEVICRLVKETGCGLLLDISHARIAAHALGLDAHEYMNALPVHRLRELHFTGLHAIDGRLVDHLPALESDWPELAWVLDRIHAGDWAEPWLLAFEYGGVGEAFAWRSDPQVIAAQLPRLWKMVH